MEIVADKQMDRIMEAMQRVEQDLRDCHWMAEEVANFHKNREKFSYTREELEEIVKISTVKFGPEAVASRPVGLNSDITFWEAKKLLRQWERVIRYEHKLKRLEEAVAKLEDERERVVAEGLMDGVKINEIAQQLDVSRRVVYDIKQSVIRKLAVELYLNDMIAAG